MLKMFLPSRHSSDLGGNGGCGGMVSVLALALLVGLGFLVTRAFADDTPAESWQPQIMVQQKDGGIFLLAHRDRFPDKVQCDLYLSSQADAIKTMLDEALGDRLEKYDAKCVSLVAEHKA